MNNNLELDLENNRKYLAKLVAERRAEMGMTQAQLAEKTGMGLSTIKRFEGGRFWINLKQFFILVEAVDAHIYIDKK